MKKLHKVKSVSFLLVLLLVLCQVLVACADKNDTETNEPNNNIVDDTGDDVGSTDEPVNEDLYPYPEHDFDGAVINIIARKDGWADGSQDFDDLTVEGETGEVLNDAVYTRTKIVEEKYKVEVKVTPVADPTSTISKSVKAGDDEYQLIQEKLVFMSETLAAQNLLYDFGTIDSINLDAPWYNQNAIKDLSINKKVTVLGGDISVSDKSGVIMAVFSKKLTVDYGIENLYSTVKDGKWTLDKLYELIVQTTVDLNGDGAYTIQEDQWGLACEDYAGWMLSVASGNRLANLDDNGTPYMTCAAEKSVNDYEKIKKVLYEKQGRVNVATPQEHEGVFIENRCLFSVGMLSQFTAIRSMDEDFGIIPLPKQDETQKDYITTISPWVSRFIAMPATCGNPEMVGAVIDAMSRESANTVVPAYYENLLNLKIARDEESVDMLKMIFGSVVYDIGSVFNWGDIWNEQMRFISGKKEDYFGDYDRISGKVEAALAKTIEIMEQYK